MRRRNCYGPGPLDFRLRAPSAPPDPCATQWDKTTHNTHNRQVVAWVLADDLPSGPWERIAQTQTGSAYSPGELTPSPAEDQLAEAIPTGGDWVKDGEVNVGQ
jgi:hypothetical protein